MPESLDQIRENVRAANDILDVIGGYITVKRAGSGYKALCPFHKEKTPSFVINQARQSYHCFGCGAGGDVFKFVMQQEGVDFMTSMRMLADRAGISINLSGESTQARSDKDVLYRLHEELTAFYQRVLIESAEGRAAREYLERRGIDRDAIAEFKIGYAPDKNTLIKWGGKNEFTRDQLLKAGVLVEKNGDVYDRFRGRIMFPISDALGRVIGFSGRILDESRSPAKYLNTPETTLFKKSRVLYGYHRARKSITDLSCAIVCEGQLDCIRCQTNGFENTVAPQGTALTDQQAAMIKRQADAVVLLFDPDDAGVKAAIRSSAIMLAQSLSVSIAVLPPDSDPDTLIREQGADALRALIDAARSPVAYLIDHLSRREDAESHAGAMRISRKVLELIAQSGSAVQRDRFIAEAAELLKVSSGALLQDMTVADKPSDPVGENPRERPQYPRDQIMILSYLHHNPQLRTDALEFLDPDVFTSDPCRIIFSHIVENSESGQKGLAQTISARGDDTIELAALIDNRPPPQVDSDYPVEDVFFMLILRIMHKHFRRRRDQIRRKQDRDEPEQLLQSNLTNWMAQLKKFSDARELDRARRFLKTVLPKCLTTL